MVLLSVQSVCICVPLNVSRIRAEHAQRGRIFAQMIERALNIGISSTSNEIEIKQVIPRRTRQWPRFDLGEIEITQREDAQRFEQRAGRIF